MSAFLTEADLENLTLGIFAEWGYASLCGPDIAPLESTAPKRFGRIV